MSLVTVDDAKHLRYGFDVEGIVKGMTESRCINKRNGDVALVCDALLSDGLGHMIKVSFWNDDIKKVRNNLKIKITNAYTKIFQGDVILYKSKNGSIDILDFNPDLIFDDMEKFQRYHKDIKFITQYYDHVKNTKSSTYLGLSKSEYLDIIDKFLTIHYARKQHTRQNKSELEAIYYLHQVITLSPVRIRQILGLFGINVDIDRILRMSCKWDEERFIHGFPKINHKTSHSIDEKDGDEMYHFEYILDGLSNDLVIEDSPRNDDDFDKPLCEGNSLEYHRKYKGYVDFYANPW